MSTEELVADPRIKSLLRKWGVRITQGKESLRLEETGIGPVLTADMRGEMVDELRRTMDEIRKESIK